MITIQSKPMAGDSILYCIKHSIQLATMLSVCVELEFNGVKIPVYSDSSIQDLHEFYEDKFIEQQNRLNEQ